MTNTDEFGVFREQFWGLIKSSEHIAITSHYSPDDDSIGSVLATYTILTEKFPNKNIRIIYTGEPSTRHKIFFNFEKIEWVDDVAHHISDSDLLIMLDASQYSRFSKNPDELAKVSKTIMIDHHASTPDNATLAMVKPGMSSNSELLYHIFNPNFILSKSLAEYFLLGILGDTGNFSYVKPEQTEVFKVAKKLVDTIGVSVDMFRSRYGGMSGKAFALIQELVRNTTLASIEGWPDFQYAFIERSVLEKNEYTDEDISAASHMYMGMYLTRMYGYAWGFVLTPRNDGSMRISSRSLPGSVNVRLFFEGLGVGSGHDRASGGAFKKETADREVAECIAKTLEWMKNNKPVLG